MKFISEIDRRLENVYRYITSNNRLQRTTVSISITLAVVFAVLIRTAGFRLNGYEFFEFDSYIEYWQAEYVYRNGLLSWYTLTRGNPDTHLFWYPWGRDFTYSSYPFLPMWIGSTYHLARYSGLTLREWAAIQPVLFAALATMVVYFAVLEVSGSRLAGIISSYLFAVLPAAVERSVLGYVEKEGVSALFIFLFILFYARGLKKTHLTTRKWLIDLFLASLSLSMVGWLWGGFVFILGTIAVFLVLAPVFSRRYFNRGFVVYNVLVILLAMIMVIPSPANASSLGVYPFRPRGLGWIIIGVLTLPLVYYLLGVEYRKLGLRKPIIGSGVYILLLVFSVIAGLVLTSMGILPIGGRLAWALGLRFVGIDPLVESIAEHQSPLARPDMVEAMVHSWGILPLFISVMGAIYLLYKGAPEKTYIAIAFGVSFYAYLNAVYMIGAAAYFGVVAVSAFTAILTQYAFPYIQQIVVDKKRSKRTTTRRRVGTGTRLFTLLLFIAITVNTAYVGYADYEKNSKIVYTFKAGVSGIRFYSNSWYRAVEVIRSLPEDVVVIAWWDYGYGISVAGGRRSVADGSTLNITQIGIIGLIMLSNTTEHAARLAGLFNAKSNKTYLMVIEGALIAELEDRYLIRPIILRGGIPGLVDWPKSIWMIRIGNYTARYLREIGIDVDYVDTTRFLYLYTFGNEAYLSPSIDRPEDMPLVYRVVVDALLYWAETRGKKGEIHWFTGQQRTMLPNDPTRIAIKRDIGLDISTTISVTNFSKYDKERPLSNDTVLRPYVVIVEPFTDPEQGTPITASFNTVEYGAVSGVFYSVIVIYEFTNIPGT